MRGVNIYYTRYGLLTFSRVTSSTLLEDRRDAVRAIKALAKKFRTEVGSQCIDVLIDVIRNDRMDTEIVGYAVEALWSVMENPPPGKDPGAQDSSIRIQFSEAFLKNTENVTMLLNLLEDFDFQVRRPTTCLITTLLVNRLSSVQEAILVSPMGISRMMDLLVDSREVIRNDALLLLMQLTRSNGQIQKIVAFENAFDRLLAIIREEGFSDGGIVVQDCLTIMQNLLKGNNSNQAFFREASLIQQLVPFFEFKLPQGSTESSWSAQKVANVYHMLKLVRTLVSPSNPQQATVSCQKVMNQCDLQKLLCSFMFAGGVPTEILVETISTVAEVIRGCDTNQQYFETVITPTTPPRSAILALLMSIVTEKQPLMLRLAALYCFQCFVYKNEAGQALIINTLLPSSAEPSISAGQVLCAGLFSQDPLSNWCTALALANSLNPTLKPQLLRVQLSMQGRGQVTLLQQITGILTANVDLKVQTRLGLLILLCTWLSNCSIAVVQFLNDAANVPFLTAQMENHFNTEQEQLFRNLCAALLGICLAYHDDSPTQYSPDTLRQIIVHRVGKDAFSECLSQIYSSEFFTKATRSPQVYAETIEGICFDYSFTVLFKQISDVILRSLDQTAPSQVAALPPVQNGSEALSTHNLSTTVEDHDTIVTSYKELIRDQDQELTELREKYAALEKLRSTDADALQQQKQEIQTLQGQVAMYADLKEQPAEGGEVGQLQSTIVSLQRIQDSQRQEIAGKNVTIERLQRDLEAARSAQQHSASASEEVIKAKEEMAQVRAENEALMTERDALDEQLRALQEQQQRVQESQSDPDSTSAQVVELQQKLMQLQQAYQQLQERNRTFEKEQEDLLVLLAEHDTKHKKYRSLLVEHNIDVSDEEESLGESDDEEEEEGEGD